MIQNWWSKIGDENETSGDLPKRKNWKKKIRINENGSKIHWHEMMQIYANLCKCMQIYANEFEIDRSYVWDSFKIPSQFHVFNYLFLQLIHANWCQFVQIYLLHFFSPQPPSCCWKVKGQRSTASGSNRIIRIEIVNSRHAATLQLCQYSAAATFTLPWLRRPRPAARDPRPAGRPSSSAIDSMLITVTWAFPSSLQPYYAN